MPRPIDPEEMHTYTEWLQLGYQVQQGEHHVGRREGYYVPSPGLPLFSGRQVRPRANSTTPPNPGAYRQAPRRVRPHERQNTEVQIQLEQPQVRVPYGLRQAPWDADWLHVDVHSGVGYASNASTNTPGYYQSVNAITSSPGIYGELYRPEPTTPERLQAEAALREAYHSVQTAEKALAALSKPRLVPEEDRHHPGLAALTKLQDDLTKRRAK